MNRTADDQRVAVRPRTPAQSGWSAVAHCVGADTCTIVGEQFTAMVGTVGWANRTDDRALANALGDPTRGLRDGVVYANELLVEGLQSLVLSDDPVNDVVQLIASVHDRARADDQAVCGQATVTVLVRDQSSIAVVHVGDASAFRLRHSAIAELTPLTRRHTLAADLRAVGRQPNARAESVVTRVVGGAEDLAVDVTTVPLESGRTSFLTVAHAPPEPIELLETVGRARCATDALDALRPVLPPDTAAIIVQLDSDETAEASPVSPLRSGRGLASGVKVAS